MFRSDTVIVLGAGASWHYGYPTGEELVKDVAAVSKGFAAYCERTVRSGNVTSFVPDYVREHAANSASPKAIFDAWRTVQEKFAKLSSLLNTVQPVVIDYFLSWNESLQDVGKLVIAAVILGCEGRWPEYSANQNRRKVIQADPVPHETDAMRIDITKFRDNWHRFIVHKLVYGIERSCQLLENRVSFVTFNYDASLEYQLWRSLTSIELLKSQDVEKFLSSDRFFHVYGSVRGDPIVYAPVLDIKEAKMVDNISSADDLTVLKILDRSYAASKGINTIESVDKTNNEKGLKEATTRLQTAKLVYILGYGFDELNNKRCGLDPYVSAGYVGSRQIAKTVLATNYGDVTAVNKRLSRLVYGNGSAINDGRFESILPNDQPHVQKSVKNVYDALSSDFEPFEERVIR
jgi:hypothetical protein